jgi:signal transduction histidine kinase
VTSPQSISEQRVKLEDVAFTVRARVAMQLGRESISSSVVAIVELVKNAYDADADNVWITFSGLGTDQATLTLEDDGSGMTTNQVKNYWMVIGTDYKARTRRSSGKSRALVGEKGLGRLGLDRLALVTRIQTFSEQQPSSGVELEIRWEEYEAHSSDPLDTIKHSLYTIPRLRPHGTILIMEGLKDSWTPSILASLKKDLSLLVSPFSEITDFKVWLNEENVSSPDLLDIADWKVNAELQKKPQSDPARWEIVRELTDPEGRMSRSTVEWRNIEGQPDCECGPVRFELYFYPRNDVKSEQGETLFTRGQIVDFLDSNQGIRIYRDGFRVKPYGDPEAAGEGDWLGLNMRRVRHPSGVVQEGRWRVAYNQVVGAVFISKDANPQLIDQTNREGLVEGSPLSDLRVFALNIVDFFEERRQGYERSRYQQSAFDTASEDAEKASEEAIKTAEKAEQVLNILPLWSEENQSAGTQSKEVGAALAEVKEYVSKLRSVVEEADRAREDMKQAYQERERAYEEKENTLANLASLGILAAFFGHETVGHTNRVINNIGLLKDLFGDIRKIIETSLAEEIEGFILRIEEGAARIHTFAKFTIGNVRTDKRYRKLLDIVGVAKDVVEAFELSQRNIEVSIEVGSKHFPQIYAFRIDWESIIINLLTNAVWALDGTEGERRSILLRLWSDSERLHFTCDDGGRGIEPGTIDRIFEPVFSTRRNARGDIVGTGMGLSIVQNLVRNYQGSINAKYNGELGGAQFHIMIPLKPNTRRGKNGK